MARARKPCNTHNCPHLQPCPIPGHAPKPWASSTRRKRLPGNWARLRQFVLTRDKTCRICNTAPATEVDHIQPGDNHTLTNLQGVCSPCHKHKTQTEAQAARQGAQR